MLHRSGENIHLSTTNRMNGCNLRLLALNSNLGILDREFRLDFAFIAM